VTAVVELQLGESALNAGRTAKTDCSVRASLRDVQPCSALLAWVDCAIGYVSGLPEQCWTCDHGSSSGNGALQALASC